MRAVLSFPRLKAEGIQNGVFMITYIPIYATAEKAAYV
jgi:hypothetical protein